jgi:hypothetical protein
MSDEEPKSAYELAMERLRKQDAEQGIAERPLTNEQKAAIEEARRTCQARLAQIEIMHQSKLAGISDPEARAALEGEYARDRARATDERDRAITKIRRADKP